MPIKVSELTADQIAMILRTALGETAGDPFWVNPVKATQMMQKIAPVVLDLLKKAKLEN